MIRSRIHIRKRTYVPQRPGRHSEIYSAQYISAIDRTIDYLVKEKNTRNISSGTQARSASRRTPQRESVFRNLLLMRYRFWFRSSQTSRRIQLNLKLLRNICLFCLQSTIGFQSFAPSADSNWMKDTVSIHVIDFSFLYGLECPLSQIPIILFSRWLSI
ncbi:hypothetical protein AVEN_198182-1 [Araneus ventricosus]|uniref:Uncharacterized protein n=1 Tax=Araneus ventricosus TaxID=182803 RepID=A0A4Y2RQ35_ARAVE|nr:hypothetical protein AVEN_256488-1 [Araneus ventricosus]GBN77505.1 hypothetical protein AVEN_198182-1 [Araneus ventricosus]